MHGSAVRRARPTGSAISTSFERRRHSDDRHARRQGSGRARSYARPYRLLVCRRSFALCGRHFIRDGLRPAVRGTALNSLSIADEASGLAARDADLLRARIYAGQCPFCAFGRSGERSVAHAMQKMSAACAPKGGSHCRRGWISNSRQIRSCAPVIQTFSKAWDLKTSCGRGFRGSPRSQEPSLKPHKRSVARSFILSGRAARAASATRRADASYCRDQPCRCLRLLQKLPLRRCALRRRKA